jgi:hypothetical protein
MSSSASNGARPRQMAVKVGAALTFAFTTAYGFIEYMAEVPRFPVFLVLPVFFAFWALAALVARDKAPAPPAAPAAA